MKIVRELKTKGLILSTAESFTGGSIAKAIISESGASEVFYEGLVCYNTNAKINRLNVKDETVEKYSVVSEEVVIEMVKGLLSTNNCNLALATTGYAEYAGNSGFGYIAVADNDYVKVEKCHFCGNRQEVIEQATQKALSMIINFLNERD